MPTAVPLSPTGRSDAQCAEPGFLLVCQGGDLGPVSGRVAGQDLVDQAAAQRGGGADWQAGLGQPGRLLGPPGPGVRAAAGSTPPRRRSPGRWRHPAGPRSSRAARAARLRDTRRPGSTPRRRAHPARPGPNRPPAAWPAPRRSARPASRSPGHPAGTAACLSPAGRYPMTTAAPSTALAMIRAGGRAYLHVQQAAPVQLSGPVPSGWPHGRCENRVLAVSRWRRSASGTGQSLGRGNVPGEAGRAPR